MWSLRTNMYVLIRLDGGDEGSRKRLAHCADWLLQLDEGCLPSVEGDLYNEVLALPPDLCVNSEDDVINHVYARLEEPFNHISSEWFPLTPWLYLSSCLNVRFLTTTNNTWLIFSTVKSLTTWLVTLSLSKVSFLWLIKTDLPFFHLSFFTQ